MVNILNRSVSYKLLPTHEKHGNMVIVRFFKSVWKWILWWAHQYVAYAFLPTLLMLYVSPIYNFHLQYVFISLGIILFCGILYSLQDRLLFHPNMPINSTFYVPFPTHLVHETVEITTSDGEKLRGFFIKTEKGNPESAPTVLYFHGNAGNVGSPCSFLVTKYCGANLLAVDYRGYGKSSGWPSEQGLYLDGRACIEYALSRRDIDPNKIVLFGHSMGGAVVIHLAAMADEADYKIAAVIVENTFTTLPQAAGHIFRGITSGVGKLPFPCYSNQFLSVEKIPSVRVPICFICGDKDEIVNPVMTKVLFQSCNSTHKVMLQVENGTHNDTWCVSAHYYSFLSTFLNEVGLFNDSLPEQSTQNSRGWEFSWGCQFITD